MDIGHTELLVRFFFLLFDVFFFFLAFVRDYVPSTHSLCSALFFIGSRLQPNGLHYIEWVPNCVYGMCNRILYSILIKPKCTRPHAIKNKAIDFVLYVHRLYG